MVSYTGRLACALALCSAAFGQSKPEIVVAAAANLSEVFRALGPQFEAVTGVHPVFSFASTAQLAQQIERAAPFDVFAAADTEHVDQLVSKGVLLAASRLVYAQGSVALWIPPGGPANLRRLEDLRREDVRVIAIANPQLAPYGQAAVAALERAGVWPQVRSKVVYAENINMARQYGVSGNADAVLTAYSLVKNAAGTVLRLEGTRVDQALGIVAGSAHAAAARQFVDFLHTGKGRETLRAYGYWVPVH